VSSLVGFGWFPHAFNDIEFIFDLSINVGSFIVIR
jgi:hypothetical protein